MEIKWDCDTTYGIEYDLKNILISAKLPFTNVKNHPEIRSKTLLTVPNSRHALEWTAVIRPQELLTPGSNKVSVSVFLECVSKHPIHLCGVLEASFSGIKTYVKNRRLTRVKPEECPGGYRYMFGWEELIRLQHLHVPGCRLMTNGNTFTTFSIKLTFGEKCQLARSTRIPASHMKRKDIFGGKDHFRLLSSDGGAVDVSKSVLAGRSGFFNRMLLHECKETKRGTCSIYSVDAKILETFAGFLNGDAKRVNQANCEDMYYLGEFYDVQDLKDLARNLMMNGLNGDNIGSRLIYAELYNDIRLKKAALDYIMYNVESLRTTVKLPAILDIVREFRYELFVEVVTMATSRPKIISGTKRKISEVL